MGSMRVLHAFLCLVRWSKLQLQGRRCICIVSRSWWWSKPAVVVWAKSAEGGSSQKLSLLVFLANAANEQFRKRKHFNINTLQNRWKLMYCRTLKTHRLCPKWMCSYSGHNATVRICVLISTTSRPYVLKDILRRMRNDDRECLIFKGLEGALLQFTPSFSPQQQNSNDDVWSSFCLVLFTMGWNFTIIWRQTYIWFCGAKLSQKYFFIRSERIILVVSPLARPPANSCETMLLSSTPFLFPKAAPVWVLHSAPVCDTVWVGRGVQLGPAPVCQASYIVQEYRGASVSEAVCYSTRVQTDRDLP